MSLTMNSSMTGSMGEVKASASKNAKASGLVDMTAALAPAKAGTLTVRTNNTDGSLTLAAGHGVATGDKVSIFWPNGIRYNATVGTVAGNVVPFTLGTGDNLPAVNAAITVMVQNLAPSSLQNLLIRGMLIGAALPFAVIFYNIGALVGASFSRDAPGDNYIYDASTGYPFPGPNVDNIAICHSDATKAQTVTCKILTDG
jgi:hypothetical protein